MEQPEKDLEKDKKIQIILNRRRILSPKPIDYQEAQAKLERRTGRKKEAIDIKKICDAVLFDWDGVMYDSMDNIAKTAVGVAKYFGKELDIEKFKETYNQPYWDYYESLGIPVSTKEDQDRIYQLYHDEIKPQIQSEFSDSKIYPEVEETLRQLKFKGLKLGIISAHKPQEISQVLNDQKLDKLIDEIVGLAHHKAEAIRKFCSDQNLNPDRVLMLGDLPSDLRDGREAGVKVGAVARFSVAEDRLGAYDPDFLFTNLGLDLLRPEPFEDII